jgi:hypothetical protein
MVLSPVRLLFIIHRASSSVATDPPSFKCGAGRPGLELHQYKNIHKVGTDSNTKLL